MFQITLLILISLVTSCGRKDSDSASAPTAFTRCGHFGDRVCTEEEVTYIKDTQFLANKIKVVAKESSLDERLFLHQSPPTAGSNGNVVFMGERHTDYYVQLDNFALLERRLGPNDVILFEGGPAREYAECMDVLYHLRCTLENERQGKPYDPYGRSQFCSPAITLQGTTRHEISLDALKLFNADCRFWDDMTAFDRVTKDGLQQRNASLVSTVRHYFGSDRTVYVVAGFLHSPIGEYVHKRRSQLLPEGIALGAIYGKFDDLSTKEVFDYLMTVPTLFISHQRLIGDEKFLPVKF